MPRRAVRSKVHAPAAETLPKAPTGIEGLDQITGGGLPRGRPTLVCGGAGCGKTLFAMEFLVHGATRFAEPGVFVSFEETAEDLAANVRSLGFKLEELVARRKIAIDWVRVERSEIEETGEYNLDGLFIRLAHAIDSVKAKRVVLDTIEALFSGFSNAMVLRAEIRRLFAWLKERGVTAVITGEGGQGQLTRQGLEEYVSDCVILLDHRVVDQVTTRRLRVVKYRGSAHGTNEYPFLIDEDGFSVLPITSAGLQHEVAGEAVSTGVPAIDAMLGAGGVYRGSTALVSGTAGTGKSSIAAHFVAAAGARGERAVIFAFEESEAQIVRNMRSIGIDLQPMLDRGLLEIHAARPSAFGLEMHLVAIHKAIRKLQPQVVVMDPITSLAGGGTTLQANSLLVRLVDFLKTEGITVLLTSLTSERAAAEETDGGVSSLVDTWMLLRQVETPGGERRRTLFVLKSRGMSHSTQSREYVIGSRGIEFAEAAKKPSGRTQA